MAESSLQEKTEAASPKRRSEARRKGQIPKSQEVNTAFLFLAGGVVVGPMAGGLVSDIAEISLTLFRTVGRAPTSSDAMAAWLQGLFTAAFFAVAPLILVAGLIVGAVAALQARGTLSTEKFKPKPENLSPIENIKKTYGVRSIAEVVKSFLKLTLICGSVFLVARGAMNDVLTLPMQDFSILGLVVQRLSVRVFVAAGVAYLIVAGADYAYQLWQHERGLRMTKDEVKRENKDAEGDGLIKARMRSLGRSFTRNRMIQSVPHADVVITNPTHIAVALKYDPEVSPAPTVLALGQRKIAQRIKQIAYENGIPVIEDKPIARALLQTAKVGEAIPIDLYMAIAKILAFVFSRRSKVQRRPYQAREVA